MQLAAAILSRRLIGAFFAHIPLAILPHFVESSHSPSAFRERDFEPILSTRCSGCCCPERST